MNKMIELSVRITDGSFDTRVTLPVDSSSEARAAVVAAWFKLIEESVTFIKDQQARK